MTTRSGDGNILDCVQQMQLFEYSRVPDQLTDSGNCLQVREFEAVRHLLPGVDWSQGPIIDFEAVMAAPARYTNQRLHQQIERLIHEGVQFTYHLMGSLDSQSSEDEGTSSAPQEGTEKPEKRKKAKVCRGTRMSKRTRREKIPIKRPEVTSSSKDPSSSDDAVELDCIPAPPSQSDIDAFEANDPPALDVLDTELRALELTKLGNQIEGGEIPSTQGVKVHEPTQQSCHELLLHNTAKDDSTVEGEQRIDETHELERVEERPSHEDVRQLFSEIGENSAPSKGLHTSFTPPVAGQLRICGESTENVREQNVDLTLSSTQTVPQEWLIARAQRKATTKPPIDLEDIFLRIDQAKAKGKKKPRAYSRVTKDEQRNRTLHIATPLVEKLADQITSADYSITTIPIRLATKEQEKEEFKDSVQNILRQLEEITAEKDMYWACAEQAKGYINQLLRPLHNASESHIPPTALVQRTTTEFEGVQDTAKAVKEWMQDIKKKGEQILKEVKEMALHRELTLIKLLEVKKESLHIHEVAATTLPLMRVLFWTHAQIPTLSAILDPHSISVLKEWYWTVTMKNDTKEIIDKESDACEVILGNMQELGKTILRSMVSGWINDLSDNAIQPDWEERLGMDKISYFTKDLEFC
ncbi:uncharacterized protein LOC131031433 [Cryptomeria japonica]|uniref:uncharacterized protein LOC131031433 n=1 Tax=Cryptomeria japonica TaxID=3369 RepID=UPI0025AD8A6E|nr:uncharacterized protein LOC131031433 [Cryptomeria japonica]XP_057818535.1 uncharacterized protein LOC131031433 [Cryptomeria japonica]